MSQQQQFAAWIERNQASYRPLRRRDLLRATIVCVNEEGMVVDLGVERDGFVLRRDLRALDKEYRIMATADIGVIDCRLALTVEYTVQGEGHPNEKAHSYWAGEIAAFLRGRQILQKSASTGDKKRGLRPLF